MTPDEARQLLNEKYLIASTQSSDINEHIETLYKYSLQVRSIVECGVRSVVSTWAFLKGLADQPNANKSWTGVDLQPLPEQEWILICQIGAALHISVQFIQGNDIQVNLPQADLFFIDTWHIYGHLTRELTKFHPLTKHYLIFHDTTIDEWIGESVRNNWDVNLQSQTTGYSIQEICTGLWPAISEFLKDQHGTWIQKERYDNNNGLTILEKNQTIKYIDAFIMMDEKELFQTRLRLLAPYVDLFIVVESYLTFTGRPRQTSFDPATWIPEEVPKHKVMHRCIDSSHYQHLDQNDPNIAWARETVQRNYLGSMLLERRSQFNGHDYCFLSDIDEIWNPQIIPAGSLFNCVAALNQEMFYYSFQWKLTQSWEKAICFPLREFKSPSQLDIWRTQSSTLPLIPDAGWHLSYFMTPQQIKTKIESFSHQELNTDYMKNQDRIFQCIQLGTDLFDRNNHHFIQQDHSPAAFENTIYFFDKNNQ